MLGGAGFLGNALVEALSKTKSNVIQVFDTFTHGFPKRPPKRKNILAPISGSVRNYYDVLRSMERFSPDVVVHLAAFNNRPETIGDFRTCAEVNYVGTANVLQACVALRSSVKKVIFASTLAAKDPVSHYGISKRASEDLLRTVFTRFPEGSRELIILRFSEIYGNGDPYSSTSLVNFLADGMVGNHSLGIYSVNESLDSIHLSDAVRAGQAAISTPTGKNVTCVDIGTGIPIAVKDLVQQLKEATDYTAQLRFLESPTVPFRTLIADPKPAKEVFGFEAKADFTEELTRLIKARRKALK